MIESNSIINLNSLLNLSAKLYESENEAFILNSTLLSIMGKLKILKAAVLIPSDDNNFVPLLIKGNLVIGSTDYFEINSFTSTLNNPEFSKLRSIGIEYLIPVKNMNSLYAVFCFGKSISNFDLSGEEIDYIDLISSITANAISSARNLYSYKNAKVKAEQRSQLLSTLFEATKDFSKNLTAEKIIKLLALNLMGQLTVSRFAVYTIDDGKNVTPVVSRFSENFTPEIILELSKIEFANDISKNNFFQAAKEIIYKHHIEVIAPMTVYGETKGLLLLGKKMNGLPFTEENLLFIEAIANSAMAAIENERLFKEELEKKRIESELSIALEIQRNLLPKKSPVFKNMQTFGISIPSRHVAGDLFDFIKINENKYLISIADVSGKGIPASLIMANFQAALKVLVTSGFSLNEIVIRLNELLYNNTSPDKFVTAFFCIIDDSTGKIEYINAGHNPPLLKRKDSSIEYLSSGGLILGFMEEPFEYFKDEVTLHEGDLLIMFTDGVTEAENISKEDYGDSRLEEFALMQENFDPKIISEQLIESVKNFAGEAPQNDDITLVVIHKSNKND